MDRNLIEQYAAGGEKLRKSIAGLSRDDLLAFPVPGTWSIQQIVIHLMDSDLIATDRMKRVAAETKPPLIIGYDESAFSRELFCDDQPAEDAVAIFDMNRRLFAKVLQKLPETAFAKFGIHNEHGKVTLRELLKSYVNHFEYHLKFIHEKRAKLGKAI